MEILERFLKAKKNSPLTIQTFLKNLFNLYIFKNKMMCFLTNFFNHNTRWQFRNWEDASSIAKKSICHVLAFAFLACLFFVLVVARFFVYVVIPSCFSTQSKAHDVWWQYFMYSHVHCVYLLMLIAPSSSCFRISPQK